MKKCINCFETKDLSLFYPKRSFTKGKIYHSYQSWCKACAPEIQRFYKKRKNLIELRAREIKILENLKGS